MFKKLFNKLFKKGIYDVTGIKLTPGNEGKDCHGNGMHYDKNGNLIECLCDECDYMMKCLTKEQKNGLD